MTLIKVTQNN